MPYGCLRKQYEARLFDAIAFAVESGKILANKIGFAEIELPFLDRGISVDLTEHLVDCSLLQHAEQIRKCALETLVLAQCSAENVDQIILVGGSSLMNVVEASIAPIFRMLCCTILTRLLPSLMVSQSPLNTVDSLVGNINYFAPPINLGSTGGHPVEPYNGKACCGHECRHCGQSTIFEFVYCPACDAPVIVTLCH
jgi:hypothetical protein